MKRFSKTLLICFLVVVVLMVALTGCSHEIGKELLSNGNFETIDTNNRLDGWQFVYVDKEGNADTSKQYKEYNPPEGSEEQNAYGKRYIEISTSDYAVAYMKTTVKLYSGQKYLLKVNFKVSSSMSMQTGDDDAVGGYFGFLEDKNFLPINATSSSGWIEREIYFKPTSTARYTFVAGIGREDLGGATGTIQFDNISIKAIKEVPVGMDLMNMTPGSKVTDKEVGGVVYTVILSLLAAALVVGAYYLIRVLQKHSTFKDNMPLFDTDAELSTSTANADAKDIKPIKPKKPFKEYFTPQNLKNELTSPIAIFIYILLAAFLVRFVLVLTVFGMGDTMTEYAKIALTIAQDGPGKLYSIQSTNLPTGWLYLLGLFGLIGNALEFTESSLGLAMLIRIPNIIADLAVCYMIYKIMANNYNDKYSAVIAGAYALLPAMFTTSVTWGMNMSIALAFTVAMLNFMLEKKHVFVPIMFTLGLLFSNFMLIALPVVIGYEIFYCIKDKKAIMPIVISSIASFVVFYCLAIPFATGFFEAGKKPNGGILVFSKMLDNIKNTGLISNSSFNFFAIFGLGNSAATVPMIILIAIIMILFVILGGYLFSKSRNRLDFVLLLAMSFILWAVFGIGSKVEFTLIGVVLLLIYAGLKMEKRVFKAFGILSITNFINTAVILTKSGAINYVMLDGTGLYSMFRLDPLYIIGSIITLGTVLYLIWVAYDIMANGVEREIKPMPKSLVIEFKDNFNYSKNRVMKFLKGKNNASKNK